MLTALTLTNCVKEKVANEPVAQKSVPFELAVGVDTKTTTADGVTINWAEGDNLNIFHAEAGSTTYSKNDEFTFDEGTNFTGSLQDGALTADAYDWYVHYPYDSHIKTPGDKTSGYSVLSNNQTQTGNDSKAHLAGSGMLLYGRALSVAKDTKPTITLKQANAVVRVHVTNKTEDPLTVTEVSFAAPVNIVGNFYVNFVGENAVFSDASGAAKSATLNVSGGAAIAKDASADFYIPIKPFSVAEGTLSVTVNGVCTKAFNVTSAVAFAEGKIKTVNVDYTGPDGPKTLPYVNTLLGGHIDFTVENVTMGGLAAIWSDDETYGVTANGYKCKDENVESYLVSPVFDLTGLTNAYLAFEHETNYFTNPATAATETGLEVKIGDADWAPAVISNYPAAFSTYVPAVVDLSAACDNDAVQFRFKYTATPAKPGRWRIRNLAFTVEEPKSIEVAPAALNWAATETDAKNVTVTVNSTATGYTVTPATDANWNIADDGNGTVTVSPKAANASTTDAKVLVLTITHKDDGELSKTVTCTQAKAVAAGSTEVTVVIEDYATANGWENGTQYLTLNVDSNITATVAGGGNSGKYYTSGNQWRTYQNESPTITIAATPGITIDKVAITYAIKNTGVLKNGEDNVASGDEVTVNANSIVFNVGNTGEATNGQVNITQIYVKYHS